MTNEKDSEFDDEEEKIVVDEDVEDEVDEDEDEDEDEYNLYCPYCNQKVYDYEEGIDACEHTIAWYGTGNCELIWEKEEFEKLFEKYLEFIPSLEIDEDDYENIDITSFYEDELDELEKFAEAEEFDLSDVNDGGAKGHGSRLYVLFTGESVTADINIIKQVLPKLNLTKLRRGIKYHMNEENYETALFLCNRLMMQKNVKLTAKDMHNLELCHSNID